MRKLRTWFLVLLTVAGCQNGVGHQTAHVEDGGTAMPSGGDGGSTTWTDSTCNADHTITCDENGLGSHPCCIGTPVTGSLSSQQWYQLVTSVENTVTSLVYMLAAQNAIDYDSCVFLQNAGYTLDCSNAPSQKVLTLPGTLCGSTSSTATGIAGIDRANPEAAPGPAPPPPPMVSALGVLCRTGLYGVCGGIVANLGSYSTRRASLCKGVCKNVLDYFNNAANAAANAMQKWKAIVLKALALVTVIACEPVCQGAIWIATGATAWGCVNGANWVCSKID